MGLSSEGADWTDLTQCGWGGWGMGKVQKPPNMRLAQPVSQPSALA
jgi:hypothetical protein